MIVPTNDFLETFLSINLCKASPFFRLNETKNLLFLNVIKFSFFDILLSFLKLGIFFKLILDNLSLILFFLIILSNLFLQYNHFFL